MIPNIRFRELQPMILFLLVLPLLTACHLQPRLATEKPTGQQRVSPEEDADHMHSETPVVEEVLHSATGIASFYGKNDGFHGRLTANGEVYDKNELTAAHRDHPFGSIVRVTNLSNERSVKVRINDRGPAIEDRIIDLSYAAARQLEFVEDGLSDVMVELLE